MYWSDCKNVLTRDIEDTIIYEHKGSQLEKWTNLELEEVNNKGQP